MNRVLTQVEAILKANIVPDKNKFGVKRIIVGTIGEAMRGLMQHGDFPAILITEGGQKNVDSSTANFIGKQFDVVFYLIYGQSIPNIARKNEDRHNELPSFNELANHMQAIFAENKRLNGEVSEWSEQWSIEPMETADGLQVLKVISNWTDDFIPWLGIKNNQVTLIVDPSEREDNFYL